MLTGSQTQAIAHKLVVVGLCCFGAAPTWAEPRNHFLGLGGNDTSTQQARAGTIAARDVEESLRTWLEASLGGDSVATQRLGVIEANVWQTFQSLPRNTFGRLAPQAVRYLAHSYFAREHGWLINGLGPTGLRPNATEMHDVAILQDKAPALVEALLETRQSDRGLSLSDVVAMIASLEGFIVDESTALLEAAYKLNKQHIGHDVDEETLHQVLLSYLLVYGQGAMADISDIHRHQTLKLQAMSISRDWPDLLEFERDIVANFDFGQRHQTNPFVGRRYSFQMASQIVGIITHRYGKWQNRECQDMKAHLMQLDLEGHGRVPLGSFYSAPPGSSYNFSESVEYLRQTGSLDETSTSQPRVLVANYLLGPSNCIASSAYYSICCLSECEGLMNEVEVQVLAPRASPQRLLALAANLSSSSVDAPRQLSHFLAQKLHAIAERHEGEVPLHGRLFAQWLHYAFPRECRYPSIIASAEALAPSRWFQGQSSALLEEREMHIAFADEAAGAAGARVAQDSHTSHWNDEEILPLLYDVSALADSGRGGSLARFLGGIFRAVPQLAVVLVGLRSALTGWRTATGAARGGSAMAGKEDCVLGFMV